MIFTCKKLTVLGCIILLSQVSHVHAMSLLDAYEAALQHDSTYRSALHENEAGQQKIHQLLIEVYASLGFPVVHVPILSPNSRVDFILQNL